MQCTWGSSHRPPSVKSRDQRPACPARRGADQRGSRRPGQSKNGLKTELWKSQNKTTKEKSIDKGEQEQETGIGTGWGQRARAGEWELRRCFRWAVTASESRDGAVEMIHTNTSYVYEVRILVHTN